MNTNTPSDLILRITGAYIEDDQTPKPPLWHWIQAECRQGCFREAIENRLKQEPEPLRADLTVVESVDSEKITVRIPARLRDHENTSTFELDALFEVNPVTLEIKRL